MVEPQKSARTVVFVESKPQDPNKKEGVEYKATGIPDVSYNKLKSLVL